MKAFRRANSHRRGLALILALVCLVIATSLGIALLRQAQIQRGLVRSLERQVQAEWLAESGLARAASRLAIDRGYAGEEWQVPAAAFGGRDAGLVRIVVSPIENQSGKRRVRAEADYPSGDPGRARRSCTLTVDLGPNPSKGPS